MAGRVDNCVDRSGVESEEAQGKARLNSRRRTLFVLEEEEEAERSLEKIEDGLLQLVSIA